MNIKEEVCSMGKQLSITLTTEEDGAHKFIAKDPTTDQVILTSYLDNRGLAHGEADEYYEGKVFAKLNFKHGNLDGKQEMYEGYSDNEEPDIAYYENGVLVEGSDFVKNEMPNVKNIDIHALEEIAQDLVM